MPASRTNHADVRYSPYRKPIYEDTDEDGVRVVVEHHGDIVLMPQEDVQGAPAAQPQAGHEIEHQRRGPDNDRIKILITLLILTIFSLFIHIQNIRIALRILDHDGNED
ncbi:hypothetical protein AAF712_004692 [Marasmius tenuissimus]|uniref:Uncharacterized protein n=1 Tax=Marasmius tenuissimus TaxID=585030 RepID=A0ABR3A424_9AGAR